MERNPSSGVPALSAGVVACMEAVPERLVVCSESGEIVYVSSLARPLFGAESSALTGQRFDQYVEPTRALGDLLDHLLRRGTESPTVATVRHARGVSLDVRLAARRATLDGVERVVVSLRDLPNEPLEGGRQADAASELYRAVFEQSPLGIFHYDRALKITACNQAFADMIGSPARLLVGLDMNTLPDTRTIAVLRRSLEGEIGRFETEYHSVTGSKAREVRIVASPVHQEGEVRGGLGIVLDVTPQKEAERALVRWNEQLRRLFEHAPDAIAIVADGTYVQVNSRLAELLGYENPEELVGTLAGSSVVPSQRELQAERLTRIAKGAHLPPHEYRLQRKDGEHRYIEVSSIPFEYEGKPAVVAFGRDVTERRELEARLVQADRLASVGTLAAGVGHELNNPLGYVMLTLEVLERKIGKGPERAALLGLVQRAHEGCERIRSIVRDLSVFSRRSEGEMAPLDLSRVVENSVRLVQHTVRHKAALTVTTNPVPPIAGDEARLGQVVVNLIVNAAQAMPEGEAAAHRIAVRTEADEVGVRVVVEDDGPGMPEEVLKHAFEPFFTTKAPGEGTGLGLSICHGIVREHGGLISIESRVGEGTRVIVELPPLARADTLDASGGAQPRLVAPRSRLLVIDDEKDFAEALAQVLAKRHVVSIAYDGPAALALLREDPAYDLILCDVMMATHDGPSVYADIAREFPSLEPRVVFMTGGAVTRGVRERLAALNVPRLDKPFPPAEVDRFLLEVGTAPR